MADNNTSEFAVRDLLVRETPTLTASGRTAMTTTVSFSVGAHGPFTIVYPGLANSAQIGEDVRNKVNELWALGNAVRELNKQLSES
jgi:Na+/H+-translocating membrane pyrophosphatase